MTGEETIQATSGGQNRQFTLDWKQGRWTSGVAYDMADFPFIAHIHGKRYELYGDGTFGGKFDERSLSIGSRPSSLRN